MATNKKEAFRQYLEAAGVLDAITKSQLHCTSARQKLLLQLRSSKPHVFCSSSQLIRRNRETQERH